jgi:Ribosomal protein L7Ae/L30e/S12e/Gadd45 family
MRKGGTVVNIYIQGTKKPLFVKYGLNHIVALIESKKASLVVISHDVDPIELRACRFPACLVPQDGCTFSWNVKTCNRVSAGFGDSINAQLNLLPPPQGK